MRGFGPPPPRHSRPQTRHSEEPATRNLKLPAPKSLLPWREKVRMRGFGPPPPRHSRPHTRHSGPHTRHSGPRAGIQDGCAPTSWPYPSAQPVIPAPEPESRTVVHQHRGPTPAPNPSFRPPSRNPGRLCTNIVALPQRPTRHSGPRAGIQDGCAPTSGPYPSAQPVIPAPH